MRLRLARRLAVPGSRPVAKATIGDVAASSVCLPTRLSDAASVFNTGTARDGWTAAAEHAHARHGHTAYTRGNVADAAFARVAIAAPRRLGSVECSLSHSFADDSLGTNGSALYNDHFAETRKGFEHTAIPPSRR